MEHGFKDSVTTSSDARVFHLFMVGLLVSRALNEIFSSNLQLVNVSVSVVMNLIS